MASLPIPRDLTLPEPGSTTARDVLSRAIGRLLRELRPLLRTHAASAPEDVAAVDRVLATLLRDDAAPLASVLRRPHVGALVRTLRVTPPGRGEALLTELLATLLFDLGHLGALRQPVVLRRRPPRVVSLLAHTVVPPPDAPPFHRVDEDTVMALVDNNPLAMEEAHPDKQGNAIDLGGRPVDVWLDALRDALARVDAHLPDVRREMALYLQALVPVGYHAERHLSASFREAIGTVYLSLHPNAMTMTEALIHEFQHNKLNALLELDDVLENPRTELYTSPVRPDPRPIRGVLLAVHAFVPVARLYERMLEARDPLALAPTFEERYHDVVRINREAMDVLRAHGQWTPVGRGLYEELLRWDTHYAGV